MAPGSSPAGRNSKNRRIKLDSVLGLESSKPAPAKKCCANHLQTIATAFLPAQHQRSQFQGLLDHRQLSFMNLLSWAPEISAAHDKSAFEGGLSQKCRALVIC